MKIAYCDCFSGISGDMFLGALVDAGLPVEMLEMELQRLGLPEKFSLKAAQVKKGAISATLIQIEIENEPTTHAAPIDHAETHEHPHEHEHDSEHHHDHEGDPNAGIECNS